ncbi:MAG: hypothetical protein HC884_01250 [Chloroflexaceae bacterium]|nr:hypothetical protein [Chloroflexaceae bacterium]
MEPQIMSWYLVLALIGWVATTRLVAESVQLTPAWQRVIIVGTWLLWVVPAFDILVHQNVGEVQIAVSHGLP